MYRPLINDAGLETEKNAVIEEYRIRKNEVDYYIYDKVLEMLSGSRIRVESIKKITVDGLVEFHKKHYDPRTFSILCNCDVSALKKVKANVMGAFKEPFSKMAMEVGRAKVDLIAPLVSRRRKDNYSISFLFPTDMHRHNTKCVYLMFLSSHLREVLMETLRYKLGLIYNLNISTIDAGHRAGFYITMKSDSGSFAKIREILKEKLSNLKENGIEELEGVKQAFINRYKYSMLSEEFKTTVYLNRILSGVPKELDVTGIIKGITHMDVVKFCREMFKEESMSIIKA